MDSIFLTLLLLLLLTFFVWLYKLGHKNRYYFRDRGLKHLNPAFLFGNVAVYGQSIYTFLKHLDTEYANEKMIGLFDFRTPVIFLRDPQLIKQLTVKHFDHFTDHRVIFDDTMDKLFGCSVFFMRGQKWKDMRSTLTPAFTSRQMRSMLPLMLQITHQTMAHLRKEKESGLTEFDIKDVCSRFANDIIAICAFGIEINSFEHRDNEFFEAGQALQKLDSLMGFMRMFALRLFPCVTRALDIQMFDMKTRKFFKKIILDAIEFRKSNEIVRPDLINLLMKVKSEEGSVDDGQVKRVWTDDELVAQCFVFFIAGFDSTSNLIQFCCYELAKNENVQQRLYEECKESQSRDGGDGGEISYEVLMQMKYLDMVIKETLRRWPPVPLNDRMCTKDLEYKEAGYDYHFEKGTGLWFSPTDLSMNPEFLSDPEKFDPERFAEDAETSVNQDTLLALGSGPRSCLGSRFAMMETKSFLYHLLLDFQLVPTEKTPKTLKMKELMGTAAPQEKIYVDLKKRE